VRVEDKRQGPPKLHDLPSLQKLCGSRFGWPASKTLEVAQQLYDGQGKKIITYPRAEVRYLPQSLISDVPQIVAGLRVGQLFSTIPVPNPPIIRKGASGTFYDKGLEGASHHAVIPNVNTIDKLREVWPRLSSDEKKLFDVIARAYLAALMPDFRYRQTTATLDVGGFEFRASGRQPIDLGWRAAFPDWQPADEKGDEAQLLPTLRNGETAQLHDPKIEDKETRPPPRYNEGSVQCRRAHHRQAQGRRRRRRISLAWHCDRQGPGTFPPTPAMKRFADSLVRRKRIKPPPGYKTSISICRKFLSEHAPKKAEGETAGKLSSKPVSSAQMLYAKKIALGKGAVIPEEAKANSAAMSAWIDSNRSAKRRRRSRKNPYKPTGSVAPRSTATTKRSRKRKADTAAAPPASTQPNSVTGTLLRIPYGNKEVALKLGARYRSGGWYAPPGLIFLHWRARIAVTPGVRPPLR